MCDPNGEKLFPSRGLPSRGEGVRLFVTSRLLPWLACNEFPKVATRTGDRSMHTVRCQFSFDFPVPCKPRTRQGKEPLPSPSDVVGFRICQAKKQLHSRYAGPAQLRKDQRRRITAFSRAEWPCPSVTQRRKDFRCSRWPLNVRCCAFSGVIATQSQRGCFQVRNAGMARPASFPPEIFSARPRATFSMRVFLSLRVNCSRARFTPTSAVDVRTCYCFWRRPASRPGGVNDVRISVLLSQLPSFNAQRGM